MILHGGQCLRFRDSWQCSISSAVCLNYDGNIASRWCLAPNRCLWFIPSGDFIDPDLCFVSGYWRIEKVQGSELTVTPIRFYHCAIFRLLFSQKVHPEIHYFFYGFDNFIWARPKVGKSGEFLVDLSSKRGNINMKLL